MMNRKAIVSLIGMNTGDYCNKGVHVLLQLTPDACVMETWNKILKNSPFTYLLYSDL